jgi:isopentenyl-diphosphate delta-isomerase type 1
MTAKNTKAAMLGQNPDELFDVVDESDKVIRQAPRHEVHEQGLRHRAIYVFVFNAQGQIYLQKRSMHKDYAPGTWASSCSGHLDAGETYDKAALRELGEEIGLHVKKTPERWLRLRACEETGWEFLWIYQMQNEGPFTLNASEIEEGKWFTPAEITEGVTKRPQEFAPSFSFVWRRLALELEQGVPSMQMPEL